VPAPIDAQTTDTKDRQEALADANDRIGALARTSDPSRALVWTFWCECGDPGCSEHVDLPLERFDGLRQLDRWPLAPGHERARARANRETATRLREESRALRNQARHVVRRTEQIADALAIARMKELMCAVCGYGVCARTDPPVCPMCQSSEWLTRSVTTAG
jgi:hypothetical protein